MLVSSFPCYVVGSIVVADWQQTKMYQQTQSSATLARYDFPVRQLLHEVILCQSRLEKYPILRTSQTNQNPTKSQNHHAHHLNHHHTISIPSHRRTTSSARTLPRNRGPNIRICRRRTGKPTASPCAARRSDARQTRQTAQRVIAADPAACAGAAACARALLR